MGEPLHLEEKRAMSCEIKDIQEMSLLLHSEFLPWILIAAFDFAEV